MIRFAALLSALLAVGCKAPPSGTGRSGDEVLGEAGTRPRVEGWRLVERTYAQAYRNRGVAGDGDIPDPAAVLIFEPVSAKTPCEYGALGGSSCEHELELHVPGSHTRGVGELVTAEGRILGAEGLYHELVVEPRGSGVLVMEVRGATPKPRAPGHYFVRGNGSFEVTFTSRLPGRGTVAIWIVREV